MATISVLSVSIPTYPAAPPEKLHLGSVASVNSAFSPIGSSDQNYPVCVSQLTLDDFDLVKVIGKGGFSKGVPGKVNSDGKKTQGRSML